MPGKPAFTNTVMMYSPDTTANCGDKGRFRRFSFVALLLFGLLASLMHCTSCELELGTSGSMTVAISLDQGNAPDVPDQQLPCHSGHCLSHVMTQRVATAMTTAGLVPRTPSFGEQQPPAALAGNPLFKPPRT